MNSLFVSSYYVLPTIIENTLPSTAPSICPILLPLIPGTL